MATIKREEVREPDIQQEEIQSDAIGGKVIVRGMLLTERMAMWDDEKAREGETPEEAKARASISIIPATLARSVFLDDGTPLWTVEQWDRFASKNNSEALRLFDIAQSFNGADTKAIEKNSPPSPSADSPSA